MLINITYNVTDITISILIVILDGNVEGNVLHSSVMLCYESHGLVG